MIELGHLTTRKPPFRYAAYTRVGFSDTDAQGVVYYGRYLPYFDLARTEYHRHLGEIANRARVRRCGPRRSSTTRPRASTTCSRSSCGSSGSGRPSVTYEYAAYRLDDDEDALMVDREADARPDRPRQPADAQVPDEFRARVAGFEGAAA